MTDINRKSWTERVKAVILSERQQREADGARYDAICQYLSNYEGEEIEELASELLPDGRQRGSKRWRGLWAFSFRVENDVVYVREGGDDDKPEEPFNDLEAALDRMAQYMAHTKQRARIEGRRRVA